MKAALWFSPPISRKSLTLLVVLVMLVVQSKLLLQLFSGNFHRTDGYTEARPKPKTAWRSGGRHDDGLSACLLIKDQNRLLVEWLAYHFHVLPLRHLVVAIDPFSQTSPVEVLRRWTGDMSVDVVVWTDRDFMDDANETAGIPLDVRKEVALKLRRDAENARDADWALVFRQNRFARRCLAHFKRLNRTWTLLTDTDEFLVFNRIDPDEPTEGRDAPIAERKRDGFPKVGEMTVRQYLEERSHLAIQGLNGAACIHFPRDYLGPNPTDEATLLSLDNETVIPDGFDADKFYTLKYFHRSKRARLGKTIIDVSRVSDKGLRAENITQELWDELGNREPLPGGMNIHGIVPECGGWRSRWPSHESSVLRVHEYGGMSSLDDKRSPGGMARRDPRRSGEEKLSIVLNGTLSLEARPWLQGFVQDVGRERAMELLEGAGQTDLAHWPKFDLGTFVSGKLSSYSSE